MSNMVQSESCDNCNLQDIGFKTYLNFLKVITKKLGFKINHVYYRNLRAFNHRCFEKLALSFPNIKFVHYQDDDCMTVRNICNSAALFAR